MPRVKQFLRKLLKVVLAEINDREGTDYQQKDVYFKFDFEIPVNEQENAQNPLPEGPFAKFLKTLSFIQTQFPKDKAPIRTALVTARNAPAHERVIRTLRAWNVRIDEVFFLGGVKKSEVLKAFNANIFFDDQTVHTDPASKLVPSARVPYRK